MDNTEIKANELIVEAIEKLVEKYQKVADKEKAKIKKAKVTYKGMEYTSEKDLQEGYACDCFSSSTYDRLLEKLNKARGNNDPNVMTDTECLILCLNMHKTNLLRDVQWDRELKRREAETAERMQQLQKEGYSYSEAETIVGNEELMRYE